MNRRVRLFFYGFSCHAFYSESMTNYFITGTDTNIGKSVAAAWAMLHLDTDYWKPVQSGTKPPTDTQWVQQITQLSHHRFHEETYRLRQPLSPHEAAKRDGIKIEMSVFQIPESEKSMIIEGAGGVMVPLNRNNFVIDLIEQLETPVILVARSGLGTINHTLLSLAALRARNIDIKGVIMNGVITPHNRDAIEEYGEVPIIAEIDQLPEITTEALLAIKPEIEL